MICPASRGQCAQVKVPRAGTSAGTPDTSINNTHTTKRSFSWPCTEGLEQGDRAPCPSPALPSHPQAQPPGAPGRGTQSKLASGGLPRLLLQRPPHSSPFGRTATRCLLDEGAIGTGRGTWPTPLTAQVGGGPQRSPSLLPPGHHLHASLLPLPPPGDTMTHLHCTVSKLRLREARKATSCRKELWSEQDPSDGRVTHSSTGSLAQAFRAPSW